MNIARGISSEQVLNNLSGGVAGEIVPTMQIDGVDIHEELEGVEIEIYCDPLNPHVYVAVKGNIEEENCWVSELQGVYRITEKVEAENEIHHSLREMAVEKKAKIAQTSSHLLR